MPRIAPGARLRLFAQGEAFASALGHCSRLAGSLQPTSLPLAPASQPREGPEREYDLNGHVEVFGDLQGEAERGRILAPLQVADRLVVDSQGLGEFATRRAALGPQHGDAIVYRHSVPPGQEALPGGGHRAPGDPADHLAHEDRGEHQPGRRPRAEHRQGFEGVP